jgi:hypothetical protein
MALNTPKPKRPKQAKWGGRPTEPKRPTKVVRGKQTRVP